MPQRPKRIRRDAGHYSDVGLWFHLTIHAHPELQRWPSGVADAIWRTVIIETSMPRVEVAAACLMPDHIHFLLAPRENDVLRFLNVWKSISTRAAWACGHRGSVWQPGMWDRTIRGNEDFGATLDYIVRNPVTAELVEDPELWPWLYVAPMPNA